MKFIIPAAVAVSALSVTVGAHDTTVKSETKVKAGDAQVVSLAGCRRQDAATGTYALVGMVTAAGESVTLKSETRTEVEEGNTEVKTRTKTSTDDGAVGTAGMVSTYTLMPA